MDIQYIGEWWYTGQFGHLCTLISMVGALLATISYFIATTYENRDPEQYQSWKKLARAAFLTHGTAVLGIIVTLFFLILYHRFEFKYVWQHSSTSLPTHYIISCFWAGQEGSFLLWSFWTVVLGVVLMWIAKQWEARVMTFVSFMQIFLAAMLIGIYFFDYKIGSSPFLLLRDDPELGVGPIFMRANYLQFIEGRGLNPLLQNYWMVIHPPTLFLGFAASLIPFTYVLAGLWKKDFTKQWIKPTLNWSLFAGAILGTGVLMGGAWAYESLTFGGFWAWDPVENASLVPWIVLLAGIHTLLAYKHSGHALRASNILLVVSFILVLYSTFLTRSGILGDTSVHSFVDLGMSGQLLVFMFSFILLAVVLLIKNWSAMPAQEKEEKADSREFWLFVGSLIMLMLAGLITYDTSAPVINELFGTNRVIVDPVPHYNRYTIWFAITIALLSAVIQYLRYKKSNFTKFIQKLTISTIIATVLTALVAVSQEVYYAPYVAMLWVSWYAVVANLNYLFVVLSGKVKVAGGSIAHIGFGLMLLGILLSAGKKEILSKNTLRIDYTNMAEEEKEAHVLLYKGKPIQMGPYWVTYVRDSVADPNFYYELRYERKEKQTDTPTEVFTLYPNAQINPEMGLIANPDTRHYWTRDIFTHVSQVTNKTEQEDGAIQMKELKIGMGDTIITSGCFVILDKINPRPLHPMYLPMDSDIVAGVQLTLIDIESNKYTVEPVYYIRDNVEHTIDASVEELGITIDVSKILPEEGKVLLKIIETDPPKDFVVLKAMIFPYINVLWLGCFVMVIGFFISIRRRYGEK